MESLKQIFSVTTMPVLKSDFPALLLKSFLNTVLAEPQICLPKYVQKSYFSKARSAFETPLAGLLMNIDSALSHDLIAMMRSSRNLATAAPCR